MSKVIELKMVTYDEYVSNGNAEFIPDPDIPMHTVRLKISDNELIEMQKFNIDVITEYKCLACQEMLYELNKD